MELWNFTYDAFGHKVEWVLNGSYYRSFVTLGRFKLQAVGQTVAYSEYPFPGRSLSSENGGDTGVQISDWQGTVRAFFNYTCGIVNHAGAHAPFGEAYAYAGGYPGSFTGEQSDGSMNNTTYYFPERQYRSSQGRWLSPDPGGLAAVDFSNPQSWNRYAYVLNNPLSATDPLGLFCVWDDGSYDSNDDADTGNQSACENGNGGTWFNGSPSDWDQNAGDWSGQSSAEFAGWAQGINPSVGDFGDPSGTADASVSGIFSPVSTTTSSLPSLICTLQAPGGSFTLGPNAVALFQPPMTNALNAAFGNLNSQGVVPMITSGFRTAADQQRMLQGSLRPQPSSSGIVASGWYGS